MMYIDFRSLEVWDAKSRGMLVLGGFNSSFFSDLWRYVALPAVATMVAECPQGQASSKT